MDPRLPDPNPTPPDPPDKILVERARRRDSAAFDELVNRHQRKIYALVYHMTGNRQDAEDITQDVFVKAYSALRHFKGDSAFYTWIYRIAVNRSINHLKRRKRATSVSLDDMDQGVERDPALVALRSRESPIRDLSLNELQKKLNAALQTLSEKHRTVVVMHDIEGIPHDEIAKILGCSVGTMRSRLFYARQQLRKELAEFET